MHKPNAKTAIKILSELKSLSSPENLAYFVTPNTILTLSGARAYSDGIFYSNNEETLKLWDKEIATAIDILKTKTNICLAENKIAKSVTNQSMASYEIVFYNGLKGILENTNLINKKATELLDKKLNSHQLFSRLESLLRQNKELSNLNSEDLGHIAFGILLGYPDKAILSSVTKWSEKNPFSELLIDADIRGASYYDCPQPIYSYPRSLASDISIKTHEKLWSSILKDYFTSDFHKNLEQNKDFKLKLKQLDMLLD